jgi:hypothetical protein
VIPTTAPDTIPNCDQRKAGINNKGALFGSNYFRECKGKRKSKGIFIGAIVHCSVEPLALRDRIGSGSPSGKRFLVLFYKVRTPGVNFGACELP